MVRTGYYSVTVTNLAGSASFPTFLTVWEELPEFVAGSGRCLTNGTFQFTLTGRAAGRVSVQASTNLADWTVLRNLTILTNPVVITDSETSLPRRFYRVQLGQ